MTKHIVICADDYGQTLPITQAILALIKERRLTAVSCMVTGANWQHHADLVKPLINEVDIGLHFNLTHENAISSPYQECYGQHFSKLNWLLLKSQLRLLTQQPIQAEFDAQWQRFKESLGKAPDFIDGHQHVHQFPIVRNAIIDSLLQKPAPKPIIRLVNPPGWFENGFPTKKAIIKLSGTNGLRTLLTKHQFIFNPSFTGIYSFEKAPHYRTHVQSFLQEIGDHGLMMCHPGLTNQDESWPLSMSRPLEYAYLASNAFLEDLANADTQLTRFSRTDLF